MIREALKLARVKNEEIMNLFILLGNVNSRFWSKVVAHAS